MEIDGTTITEGQHNCPESSDQRELAGISAATIWKTTATPWMILAVWLTAVCGVVVYLGTRRSGFLGNLLPSIMILASLLSFATWLTAWSWLGESSVRSRLAIFLTGTLGMLAITCPLLHWEERDAMTIAAEFLVGLAIPNMVLRRRGWRIAISGTTTRSYFQRTLWQFSIADILIVVTGFAAMLGLQVGHQATFFETMLLGSVAILGAPAIVCIVLSWRRIWLAVLASTAFGILFALLIDATTWHLTWQSLLEVFFYISAIFLASLWASLGWMRLAGYRIVVSTTTKPDVPSRKI